MCKKYKTLAPWDSQDMKRSHCLKCGYVFWARLHAGGVASDKDLRKEWRNKRPQDGLLDHSCKRTLSKSQSGCQRSSRERRAFEAYACRLHTRKTTPKRARQVTCTRAETMMSQAARQLSSIMEFWTGIFESARCFNSILLKDWKGIDECP